jgi:hypothetical protein
MSGIIRKPVNLGAVAGGEDEQFGYMKGRRKREDLFVLLITDGELTPDSGICLFIVDPYDEKSGNISGPCTHHPCQLDCSYLIRTQNYLRAILFHAL